jgi:hypothetical protein
MAGVEKDCGQKRDQWQYKPEKHEHGKQLNYHCLKRVHLLQDSPDDSRSGLIVRVFPVLLQERRAIAAYWHKASFAATHHFGR